MSWIHRVPVCCRCRLEARAYIDNNERPREIPQRLSLLRDGRQGRLHEADIRRLTRGGEEIFVLISMIQ